MSYDLSVKFSKENNKVKAPTKRNDDAGYDLYADIETFYKKYPNGILTLMPGESIKISTGLRFIIESGYYGQIEERGSTGSLSIKKNAGVLDSNFRGVLELFVLNASNSVVILADNEKYRKIKEVLSKDSIITFDIENKALFQLLIHKVPKINLTEVTPAEIIEDTTERGEGMVGSSGK